MITHLLYSDSHENEKFTDAFSKLGEGEMPYEIISTTDE